MLESLILHDSDSVSMYRKEYMIQIKRKGPFRIFRFKEVQRIVFEINDKAIFSRKM